jgi:hypothetical protein
MGVVVGIFFLILRKHITIKFTILIIFKYVVHIYIHSHFCEREL